MTWCSITKQLCQPPLSSCLSWVCPHFSFPFPFTSRLWENCVLHHSHEGKTTTWRKSAVFLISPWVPQCLECPGRHKNWYPETLLLSVSQPLIFEPTDIVLEKGRGMYPCSTPCSQSIWRLHSLQILPCSRRQCSGVERTPLISWSRHFLARTVSL